MNTILGIDVAKSSLQCSLMDGSSEKSRTFTNNATGHTKLLGWLAKQLTPVARVCMEATSAYHIPIATSLWEAGYTVCIANPWAMHKFAQSRMERTKTDKVDAQTIARYCQANPDLHPWKPRSAENQELVQLTRRRRNLTTEKTRLHNRRSVETSPTVLDSIGRQMAFLQDEIKRIDEEIEAHLSQYSHYKKHRDNLLGIPGFGPVTSAAILAELGDFERFDSAGQVAAYAGLTPKDHQSGSSIQGEASLSKIGNARLRTALYMPAVAVIRMGTIYSDFVQRMKRKNSPKKTIIAAVMRKLLCLAYAILKTNKPYDPNHTPARIPIAA